MKVTAYGISDQGRVRDENEDSFYIDDHGPLYVLCDGLGGHAGGGVASRTAIEIVVRHISANARLLEEAQRAEGGAYAVRVLLNEAVVAASRELYERSVEDRALAGMGTTLTLALLHDNRALVAHVGDCRLYLLRDGKIERLTRDHTVADEMVRRGDLSPEEASGSMLAHALTRCVGPQPEVLVDTLAVSLLPEDTFLLCSDGLYSHFSDSELTDQLVRDDLQHVPGTLVALANERGGGDNITGIVFRVSAASETSSWLDKAREVQQRLSALSASPAFRDLSIRRLTRLLERMETLRFDAGEVVVPVGAPAAGLYILVRGHVEGLGFTPGACARSRALFKETTVPDGMRASEPSEVLLLRGSSFDSLIRKRPRLASEVLRNLLAMESDNEQ